MSHSDRPAASTDPAADAAAPLTLDRARKGQSVRVSEVVGEDPIARRLGELGVRPGTRIAVLRRAPLGDPTVYELCGYQLCLRRSESARVRVEPLDPDAR